MPIPQQQQTLSTDLPLVLPFDKTNFSQPRIGRGICCSPKDVWYSKNHWPQDKNCAGLFAKAQETERLLKPGLEDIWASTFIWGFFKKITVADATVHIELRMAGCPRDGGKEIDLYPSVWLRTADEVVEARTPWKKIKDLVKRLRLDSPQYANIYAEGGGRLSDDSVSVAKENLILDKGIAFPGGKTLYTHVQTEQSSGSACGMLCLSTVVKDDTILEQSLSRVGGLITYVSPRQAVTSGHVMLQHFLKSYTRSRLSADYEQALGMDDLVDLQSDSVEETDTDDDDDIELVQNHQSWNEGRHLGQLGNVNVAIITDWISVMPYDTINFIIQVAADPTQSSCWKIDSSRPIPADFAMISGIGDWKHDNYYINPSSQGKRHGKRYGKRYGPPPKQKRWVSGLNNEDFSEPRDVLILVDQESESLVASVQPAKIPLIIGNATFWTRKIRLNAPLARGTSGSWVVDKISGALCGSIVLVYEGEPYALMITAEALLSDIKTYSTLPADETLMPVVSKPLNQGDRTISGSEVQESQGVSSPGRPLYLMVSDTSDETSSDNSSMATLSSTTSVASLTSSIYGYELINGRMYQRPVGKYWAPKDSLACEVMDISHHVAFLILGTKHYLAPLEQSQIRHVLDIGTGTGLWAIDFADDFPEAEVIGIDISPIQPPWVPPNLKFEIDDFTLSWTFGDNSKDFIHMRCLGGSVPDWHRLYENAFMVTKPGGWIETHEYNPEFHSQLGTIEEDSAIAQWGNLFREGSEKLGCPFVPLPSDVQTKRLEKVGFVDVQSRTIRVPIGSWVKEEELKEIGLFAKVSFSSDVQGRIGYMAHVCGWKNEEIMEYCSKFVKELESTTAQIYYYHQVVWGRKPEHV
ncbi:mrna 3 end-processing yth1 [Fusarium beomiforme]|uniref:Mrna 3 end-processing yth1 n=1 Tax=Fusarium beomiforme TaxID=44412 RepID=A0A9P5AG42_9HYPO|nr:mrna 3 end-processing yth1 [Fusarium beomiforme]